MIATVGLTLGFRKSDNLAAALGIAVSGTMLMTTALLFLAMRHIWRWSVLAAGAVAGVFFIVDATFFAANLSKFFEGGYVPLALAAGIYFIRSRGTPARRRSPDDCMTQLFQLKNSWRWFKKNGFHESRALQCS